MILNRISHTHRTVLAALTLGGWLALLPGQASAQTATIGSLVAGQITQLNVEEGQSVKQGAVLLRVDQQLYQAKLDYLKAEVELKQAQYNDAKIELDQGLDLYDRTVTSKRTLDAAQLQHDLAEASLAKAKAELKMAQAWSKYYTVRAPYAAKVVRIHTPLGSTVYKENTPMIDLEKQ